MSLKPRVLTLIAQRGEGKSTIIKKLIVGKNVCAYDINNEYGLKPYGFEGKTNRFMFFGDHNQFIEICWKVKNTVCIFEEASGFLGFNTGKRLAGLISNARHTNNYYIFVFHEVNIVPEFIMTQSDSIIIMKTQDEDWRVRQKHPKIYRDWQEAQRLKTWEYVEGEMPRKNINFIEVKRR